MLMKIFSEAFEYSFSQEAIDAISTLTNLEEM